MQLNSEIPHKPLHKEKNRFKSVGNKQEKKSPKKAIL